MLVVAGFLPLRWTVRPLRSLPGPLSRALPCSTRITSSQPSYWLSSVTLAVDPLRSALRSFIALQICVNHHTTYLYPDLHHRATPIHTYVPCLFVIA